VLVGAAQLDHGVRRLLKALRHETPGADATAARLGIPPGDATVAQVIKTYLSPHSGKLSLTRVWRGSVVEGMVLNGVRVAGLLRLTGAVHEKLAEAGPGEIVALARLEGIATGDVLTSAGTPLKLTLPPIPKPVFGLAISAERRADDVKLSAVMAKLVDEDPTLQLAHNADTGEIVLWGQGDIHLHIALDRMRTKYNLAVIGRRPQIPYKETIRRGGAQHSRFKRQSGGHGQFADIHIEVEPLARGSGIAFTDSVVGGAIPKNYIPAVEEGVREYLKHGPLGFTVVDVATNLSTGQFHAVDSSDQAFKTAGRMAMSEIMPQCDPVLLEPIHQVELSVPNAFTSRVQRLVSARRGQILGFDAKPDWPSWDVVTAFMPHSEIHDLIVELRSITLGVGSFEDRFDHLQELSGKLAERVMAERGAAAAQ
jgi:elongation factor G